MPGKQENVLYREWRVKMQFALMAGAKRFLGRAEVSYRI
jgi:hypothetical protein